MLCVVLCHMRRKYCFGVLLSPKKICILFRCAVCCVYSDSPNTIFNMANKLAVGVFTMIVVALLSVLSSVHSGNVQDFQPIDDLARNCLNAMGNMVDLCRKDALRKYDPSRLNTSESTTWETCCEAYEELDCFAANATEYCPPETANAVVNYTIDMVNFYRFSLCKSIDYADRKTYCYKEAHKHYKPTPSPNDKNTTFIDLPQANGPEKSCFAKLRKRANNNTEDWCITQAVNRWDPQHIKIWDCWVKDACCAVYESLDCIDNMARQIANLCTSDEQKFMDKYRKNAIDSYSATICKTVPYKSAQSVCVPKPNHAIGVVSNLAVVMIVTAISTALVTYF